MVGEAEVTLGEVADLLTGFPFKSSRYTNNVAHVRLLRGDNVAQGSIRWSGVKRWPDIAGAEQYLLRPGDVVLAMDRPWIEAGLKQATLTDADCPSLLVQRVARLRAKAGVDQRFLGYVLQSQSFTDYILGVQTGTAVPHISGAQIKNYRFTLPSIDHQRSAAALLGALDDKIELNRKLAETLEAIVQALFKSWFIDFDPVRANAEKRATTNPGDVAALFPAAFDADGVPRGWKIETIGDIFKISGGNTPSTSDPDNWGGAHLWATPKDLSSLSSPVLRHTERQITDAGLARSTSGLLPKGSLLLSSRAPIGYMAFATRPVAINQGFAGLIRKEVSTIYAWCWCAAHLELIKGNAGGSTFPEISKSALRGLPMLRPTDAVLTAFEDATAPIVERLFGAVEEAATLTELRQALLPRLISGELRVGTDGDAVAAA